MAIKTKRLARQAGFTLLELMVVIVILGVLASTTDRSPVFSQAFVNFSQFNLGFYEFRNCLFYFTLRIKNLISAKYSRSILFGR